MDYERMADILSDGILKQASDVPLVYYDRKAKKPYIFDESEVFFDEAGEMVDASGNPIEEDPEKKYVDDIVNDYRTVGDYKKLDRNSNVALAGAGIGGLTGFLGGAIGGVELAGKLIEHLPEPKTVPGAIAQGIVGGAALVGAGWTGAIGGGILGATPGLASAFAINKSRPNIDAQLTPEQVSALQIRANMSREAGFEAYESLMEKNAGWSAKSFNPVIKGMRKDINKLKELPTKNPEARASLLARREKRIGLVRDTRKQFVDPSKQAGYDAYNSLMEKDAGVVGTALKSLPAIGKAIAGGIKSIGGAAKAQGNLMSAQKVMKANPAAPGAQKSMEFFKGQRDVALNTAKPALKNVGLAGGGMMAGSAMGGTNQIQPADKIASESYIDALIQKQAAVETMAESKLIAEASEKALNLMDYSMFA